MGKYIGEISIIADYFCNIKIYLNPLAPCCRGDGYIFLLLASHFKNVLGLFHSPIIIPLLLQVCRDWGGEGGRESTFCFPLPSSHLKANCNPCNQSVIGCLLLSTDNKFPVFPFCNDFKCSGAAGHCFQIISFNWLGRQKYLGFFWFFLLLSKGKYSGLI